MNTCQPSLIWLKQVSFGYTPETHYSIIVHHAVDYNMKTLSTITLLRFLAAVLLTGSTQLAMADSPAGNYDISLEFGGLQRSALVHVPAHSDGTVLPLIINYHGGGGHARGQQDYTGMNQHADRYGYIVVYPNGTGRWSKRLLTWNAGSCCGSAAHGQVDDVGFSLQLIDYLAERLPVDKTRVYATGFSNGGMMAYRLAVEAGDRIAAIAPVAGGMVVNPFTPVRALPILHIHSVDDPRALYYGGLGPRFPLTNQRVNHPNIDNVINQWARYEECSATPVRVENRSGSKKRGEAGHTAILERYENCRDHSVIALWKLRGPGHVWPGGQRNHMKRLLGASTSVIDANDEIWKFVSVFSLPQTTAEPVSLDIPDDSDSLIAE